MVKQCYGTILMFNEFQQKTPLVLGNTYEMQSVKNNFS